MGGGRRAGAAQGGARHRGGEGGAGGDGEVGREEKSCVDRLQWIPLGEALPTASLCLLNNVLANIHLKTKEENISSTTTVQHLLKTIS